jgi:hypothetical protein
MVVGKEPSDRTFKAVRSWALLAIGCGLIIHGVWPGTAGNFAEVGFGFSLLGVEPLARAREEVPPREYPPL